MVGAALKYELRSAGTMSLEKIYEAALDYGDDEVFKLVTAAVAAGADPQEILDEGLVAALDNVGEQFSAGTLFVPEMLMVADAVKVDLDILRPILAETDIKPIGTVVIGRPARYQQEFGQHGSRGCRLSCC